MSLDVLGIGAQHMLECFLSFIELTACQIRLAENTVGFEVVWIAVENMLSQANGALWVVALNPPPGLIVGTLEAHRSHIVPPTAAAVGIVHIVMVYGFKRVLWYRRQSNAL